MIFWVKHQQGNIRFNLEISMSFVSSVWIVLGFLFLYESLRATSNLTRKKRGIWY